MITLVYLAGSILSDLLLNFFFSQRIDMSVDILNHLIDDFYYFLLDVF